MSKRYTINGIEHLINVLNQHPQLLSLSSLAPIGLLGKKAQEANRKQKCNCAAGPIYAANRLVFETALSHLQFGDHLIVKTILKTDELCYYIKNKEGKFVQKCI